MKQNLIAERVATARKGRNKLVISKLESGWLVIGDVQPLPGYCVFLADPVIASINDLNENQRAQYSLDVLRCGDAILGATSAARINYETWGNSEPALHTHIMPRYTWEDDEKRKLPACMSYSWASARPFDAELDEKFVDDVRCRISVKIS